MPSSKRKIGVIGVGFGAQVYIPAFRSEGWDVAAVCSRNRDKAAKVAQDAGIPDVHTDPLALIGRNDLDAVAITAPPGAHHALALAALAAGKHVFLEKPMASTVADCDKIVAAAHAARGSFMVGHICRFNPRYAAAKEAIAAGRIGKIISMSARRNLPAWVGATVLENGRAHV